MVNGLPLGIEIPFIGKTALTDFLPNGRPLGQICQDRFDEDTVDAQAAYVSCLKDRECI
jgi:hypothetical protein